MSERRRVSRLVPLAEPAVSWSRREVLGGISASLLLASCNASRATAPLPALEPSPDGGEDSETPSASEADVDTSRPLTPYDAGSEPGAPRDAGSEPEVLHDAGSEPQTPRDAGSDPVAPRDAGSNPVTPRDAGSAPPADAGPTPQCVETEDNILGPFYRDGAPERAVLTDPEFPGEALIIEGTVSGLNAGCIPLAGALLDVWQANPMAEYDLTDARFLFRGKLRSGADGTYQFSTVLPGRYLNGSVYRPRHIHLIASVDGYVTLTTQIYFADDPYLAVDPFVHPQLVIPLRREGGIWRGQFPIVLAPV